MSGAEGAGWRAPWWEACKAGDVAAIQRLLHASADPAEMLNTSNNDLDNGLNINGLNGWTALMYAAEGGNVSALRLLLDHPSADPADMLMRTNQHGHTAIMRAAYFGRVDAMRLLLDHPSADPVGILAYDSTASDGRGYSALTGAAIFAINGAGASSTALGLLFLLRRVAAGPQPSNAQAHMTNVLAILGGRDEEEDSENSEDEEEREERLTLLGVDHPDDERDECVRLLLECGAVGFNSNSPVIMRIIREVFALARAPQLLNEAVLGVAIARQ
jgi:hypothetical protein